MIKPYIKGLYCCVHKTKNVIYSLIPNTDINIFEIKINNFGCENHNNRFIIFIRINTRSRYSGYYLIDNSKNKNIIIAPNWKEINSLNELIKKYIQLYGNIKTTRAKQ